MRATYCRGMIAHPSAEVGASITITGLSHGYRGRGSEPVSVLRDASLTVAAGSQVALVGPSGSGKSTLLSILGGLEVAQQGFISVAGHDLSSLRGSDLAAYRRSIVGFVFQHFGLLETLTAAENVELACTIAGVRRSERRRRAASLLDEVGLSARARHRTGELSGGERQRVAIARALANSPALLLADEPTGNLDEVTGAKVWALLRQVNTERGATLLVVTHDTALAAVTSRVLRLRDGQLVAS